MALPTRMKTVSDRQPHASDNHDRSPGWTSALDGISSNRLYRSRGTTLYSTTITYISAVPAADWVTLLPETEEKLPADLVDFLTDV